MKSFVVLCLLVGLATATSPSVNSAWKKNTEYHYRVHGRTLAALHDVADQYTGVLVRADLKIYPKTNGILSARISQPEFAQIQVALPQGWESEIPDSQLQYKPLPLSDRPFEITMENGVVQQVVVNKDMANWEANMIKSLVSQIQIDMQGENLIPSRYNQKPDTNKYSANFKTMEATVTGQCETLYDVFQLPEHLLQNQPQIAPLPHLKGDGQIIGIVKTKNYSRCEQIADYHYGLPEMPVSKVYGNLGNLLTKSSLSLVVISGQWDRYTIQSSVTTSKIIVSPTLYSRQKGMVVSQMNITLQAVNNADSEPEPVEAPIAIGNLVYTYNNPFAADNTVRPAPPRSTQHDLFDKSDNSEAESSEERREHERRHRQSRSISNKIFAGKWGRKEVVSSESSEEDHNLDDIQRRVMPTLLQAPEIPLMPFFVGNQGRSIKSSIKPLETIVEVSHKLADAIQEPNQMPYDQTLSRFSILTQFIRIANAKELKDVSQQLWESAQQQQPRDILAWKVFRDAVAQAGTGPALTAIKDMIQTKKIRDEEASQVFAILPHTVSHPTEEYVRALFDLTNSPQVKSQQSLYETAILSFSELVRKAFVDHLPHRSTYPVFSFKKLVSENGKYAFIVKEYIPFLAQELEESVQSNDGRKTQVIIRALGNVAHAQVLGIFKPYLEGDRKMSQFERVLMVMSMDELTKTYPNEARSVLYKIFSNIGDDAQIRVASVYQLMRTHPPASMLARIAEFTHTEPSMQVRSAIKSSIESAARLTEQYRDLAAAAEAASKLIKPEDHSVYHSQSFLRQYVVEQMHLNYKHSVQTINPIEALGTSFWHYSLRLNEDSFSRQFIHLSAMLSSIQSLFQIVDNKMNIPFEKNGSNAEATQWIEKISKLLNIQMDQPEKFQAAMWVQLFGAQRFFAFDEQWFNDWKPSDILETLRNGKRFNYTKLYDDQQMVISVPTEMSFPFFFGLNRPTLINVGGQVQVPQLNLPLEFNLQGDMHIVLASKVESKVGFLTPHDNQIFVAGYDKNYQMNLPLSLNIGMNAERRLNIKIAPLEPERKENILHFSTWPYTGRGDLLDLQPISSQSNAHHLHHLNQPSHHELEKVYGPYRAYFTSDSIIDRHAYKQQMRKYGVLALIYQDEINHRNMNLDYMPELSSAKYVTVSMGMRSLEQQQPTTRVNIANKLATLGLDQTEERQKEMSKVVVDMQNGRGRVIDVGIDFAGQNKIVASLAYANSYAQNQYRHLLYLAKSNYQIYLEANTKTTQAPRMNFIEALRTDSNLQSDILIKYGKNLKTEIQIQAKLDKSEEYRRALQQSPLAQLCAKQMQMNDHQTPVCANLTSQATRLDRIQIDANFQRVDDQARNMTEKLYDWVKYWSHDYLEENKVNAVGSGNNHAIKVAVQFDPLNFETVNVTVHTPKTDAVWSNVRVHKWLRPLVVIRPETGVVGNFMSMAAQRVQGYNTAVLDASTVTTFNNRTYPIALGNCYHVFLHAKAFWNRQNQYSVLVRDSLKVPGMRDVIVVFGPENSQHQIKLLPAQKQTYSRANPVANIYVDSQLVNIPANENSFNLYDSKRNLLGQILIQNNGEIQLAINNNQLTLAFDGIRVKLAVADSFNNQVRGLVGTNNNEPYIDFMTPRNCLVQDPRHFAASYAIVDETCQGVTKEQQSAASIAPCVQRKTLFAAVVSDKDMHNHEHKAKKCSTRHQTRYTVEDGGKTICFTTRALPVCAKGCGNNKSTEKTVEVHCLKRTNTVNMYKQQIDKGASPDFSDKPVTKAIKIKVPTTCQ